jgi:23S rRNA (cytosine1962-C5)-methyltransferase
MSDASGYPQVQLKKGHERRARRGHPWLFSNELASNPGDYRPGELVRVIDSRQRLLGIGYINPRSLISVRLLRRDDGPIDEGFLRSRVESALELRDRLYPGEEVVRLIYSESDGLPGLTVDRYGDHLALQVTTAGMDALLPKLLEILEELLAPTCIVARNDSIFRDLEGLPRGVSVLRGEPDADFAVRYEGLTLRIDLMGGQKTGLFLDQRDNQRALLPGLARGTVLDAYCYQGIWGLLALGAGAEQVTGVDSSSDALKMAGRHAEANGLSDRTEWVREDVMEYLKSCRTAGRQFDVVVLDPPAFVKSRKHLKTGLRGYLDLNRKGLELVSPGGILITCSCSHHVRRETFRDTLSHAAGLARRHVRVLAEGGQSRDHPPILSAPETEYLKCLALHVDR